MKSVRLGQLLQIRDGRRPETEPAVPNDIAPVSAGYGGTPSAVKV